MKPNPPGRPKLDPTDTSLSVTLRVTSRQYERMYREAQRARMSLSDWMRLQTKAECERAHK
jgi:hypothetical protein